MYTIQRYARATAAVAALAVNVVLVSGLVSLAQHYEREALLATAGNDRVVTAQALAEPGALRCRPEPARAG